MKEEAGIKINSHCTSPGKGTAAVESAYSRYILSNLSMYSELQGTNRKYNCYMNISQMLTANKNTFAFIVPSSLMRVFSAGVNGKCVQKNCEASNS